MVLVSATAMLGVAGFGARFENTAGSPGAPVDDWPAATAIGRVGGRATLLMFVHPQCNCTKASLAELREIVDANPTAADVVLVVDDDDGPAMTLDLPGARVVHEHGEESERFGVATSGEVLLFDAAGRRQFVGGITRGRGLRGPNPGRISLEAALADTTRSADAPVFGCPLAEPSG